MNITMPTFKPTSITHLPDAKYATCSIECNHDIGEATMKSLTNLMKHPCMKGTHIYGLPNIFTNNLGEYPTGITITNINNNEDGIIPNILKNKIGMGVLVIHLKGRQFDNMSKALGRVPSRMRKDYDKPKYRFNYDELYCAKSIDFTNIKPTIATLGYGCTFVEVCKDPETNDGYLIVRTGGRTLASWVYTCYKKIAIEEFKSRWPDKTPYTNFTPVYSDNLFHYVQDCLVVQKWAVLNRKRIAENIMNSMQWTPYMMADYMSHGILENPDNTYTLYKGTTPVKMDATVTTLVSQKEGALIGNIIKVPETWGNSIPCGSGRILTSEQAKLLSEDEILRVLGTTYTDTVIPATAPMAYRRRQEIMQIMRPYVKYEKRLNTIHSHKGNYEK